MNKIKEQIFKTGFLTGGLVILILLLWFNINDSFFSPVINKMLTILLTIFVIASVKYIEKEVEK